MPVNLVFGQPRHAGGPVHLVFGGSGPVVVPDPVSVQATLEIEDIDLTVQALYDNRVARTIGNAVSTSHQVAAPLRHTLQSAWGNSERRSKTAAAAWEPARATQAQAASGWGTSSRAAAVAASRWELAAPVGRSTTSAMELAARRATAAASLWQLAVGVGMSTTSPWEMVQRLRRAAASTWQVATPHCATWADAYSPAHTAQVAALSRWELARYAPQGRTPGPVPPVTPGTRVPSTHLVFACPRWLGGPVHLVFGHTCTPTGPPGLVVVPIRSVYMTINTFSLVRLDNGFPIPATALSLSLDVDSWTWNCSFSVNGSLLPYVEPNVSGDPVIVQATINGAPIRVIVEKISRERAFGSSQLRCSGRGISAALDAPYAPVQSFTNTGARTARQLLDDIMTVNGVPIGWTIDRFDPTDWLVPTGVFSHSGTYISALNAVVGSVGAYLQPTGTTNQMDVLLRYPTPAWEWSSATPDLVLPSAVTSREGIEWVDKPTYDRVFVSGQEGGVLGRYTRAGTAGDLLAPPVVDPLITHVDAVRQRGRAIISDTGRIANVTLRLPVLSETGIIKPGTMVRYTDGPVTRIGLSRSVSLDVAMPTVYQTIEVETHVE